MSDGHREVQDYDKHEMKMGEKQSFILFLIAGMGEEGHGQPEAVFTRGKIVNFLMKNVLYDMKSNFDRKTVKFIVEGIFSHFHLMPMCEFAQGIVDYNKENVFLESGKKISDKIFKDRQILDVDKYTTVKEVITKKHDETVEGYLDIDYSKVPKNCVLQGMTLGELRTKLIKNSSGLKQVIKDVDNSRNESND